VGKPKITDKECIQCKKCAHACLDRIISFEEGRPVINEDICRLCGNCIQVCLTGTIVFEKRGCRIMAGGTFGRFAKYGTELFRLTDTDTIYPILEASVNLIKDNLSETHEDNFSLLMRRTGISPIFEHLCRVGKL
jgi:dissimilatory sulfite reductase (desulfoviridin) alpha/beta subunit